MLILDKLPCQSYAAPTLRTNKEEYLPLVDSFLAVLALASLRPS
jgi:hypothetical protein